ncbi:MAG TPA: TIGR03067 domain-containing protein [Gemmataceae bacterium]|nr:TIGR03067 domain-containing protein [Gemmataceae bacterium]
MKLHCILSLMAGMLIGGDMPQDTAPKELEKLQGVWKIATVEQDGSPNDSFKEGTVTISQNQFTTKSGDVVLRKGTVTLDPSKEPKTIDLTYEDGPQKGKSSLGIYNLSGNSWLLVFGPPGKSRPTAFQRKPNSGQRLMVLQSAKP